MILVERESGVERRAVLLLESLDDVRRSSGKQGLDHLLRQFLSPHLREELELAAVLVILPPSAAIHDRAVCLQWLAAYRTVANGGHRGGDGTALDREQFRRQILGIFLYLIVEVRLGELAFGHLVQFLLPFPRHGDVADGVVLQQFI